jgi:hypothetical protein
VNGSGLIYPRKIVNCMQRALKSRITIWLGQVTPAIHLQATFLKGVIYGRDAGRLGADQRDVLALLKHHSRCCRYSRHGSDHPRDEDSESRSYAPGLMNQTEHCSSSQLHDTATSSDIFYQDLPLKMSQSCFTSSFDFIGRCIAIHPLLC